jgi:lipopolysaccharide/colanic/teichoic acid biosynthesis glycosyltransferase
MDAKRAFDIAASVAVMVTTLPLAASAAAAMRLANGSTFFVQTRVGLNNKPFHIYKIKTMRDEFDAQGKPLDDELRTSRLGVIVRKSHIDEWPQLWNVLKGDMSLVGPRPLPLTSCLAGDVKRHSVLPGLACPSLIAGINTTVSDEVRRLDYDYVDHHSFTGDLQMLMKSAWSVVKNWHKPHYNEREQSSRAHHDFENR